MCSNGLDDKIEILIELVRSYPALYNKKLKSYKDQVVKNNAWQEIAKTLNETRELCEATFKSLKEKFTRERKAYEKRCASGAPADFVPTWEYYEALVFLNEHIQRRKTISNIKNSQHSETQSTASTGSSLEMESQESGDEMLEFEDHTENIYVVVDDDAESHTANAECPTPTPTKRQKSLEKSVTRNVDSQDKKNTDDVNAEIMKSMKFLREKQTNDDDLFCQMLATELKKIKDDEVKRKMKMKLFQTVMSRHD